VFFHYLLFSTHTAHVSTNTDAQIFIFQFQIYTHPQVWYYSVKLGDNNMAIKDTIKEAFRDTTREEFVEIMLSTLLVVGMIAVAVTMPNAVQLFRYFGKKTSREQWRIRRSVYGLERRGLIGKRLIRGQEYYVLTSAGKERAMRYELKSMTIKPQKKWDGLWRIVMFDIPEDKKSARRAIGYAIQKLGCVQYQKSVFITPYPCTKEIDFAGECFEVRKYIRIITAKDIENVNDIKKQFNI